MCLVYNGSVISHPEENMALGRFISRVLVCCRLTTSLTVVHVQVCSSKHVSCPDSPHPFVLRCRHCAAGHLCQWSACLACMRACVQSPTTLCLSFCLPLIPSAWKVIAGGPEVVPGYTVSPRLPSDLGAPIPEGRVEGRNLSVPAVFAILCFV